MADPRVSVIMTTYNAERHLREALDGILAQTLKDWEMVVVDDGSTDATLDILASCRDPRIRIVRVPRCGRIASLNHAVRLARGAYLANHDADDLSLPHRLEAQAALLDARPRVAVVGGSVILRMDGDGRPLPERLRPTDPAEIRHLLGRIPPFHHSGVMYRKSALEAIGGFDERLPCYEDFHAWVRLAERFELANVEGAVSVKRRHPHESFGALHWTGKGQRTRARIHFRYFRRVEHDWRVLVHAAYHFCMNSHFLHWRRLMKGSYRRDPGLKATRGAS